MVISGQIRSLLISIEIWYDRLKSFFNPKSEEKHESHVVIMQPVSFDNDFECQNVVEEFTFEDEGKDFS